MYFPNKIKIRTNKRRQIRDLEHFKVVLICGFVVDSFREQIIQ